MIIRILLIVIIEIIIRYLLNDTSGIYLAIAPFVIPAAMTGLTALSNLFFGEDNTEEEKYNKMLKYLQDRKAETERERLKGHGDLARITSARLKGRRSGMAARNTAMGLNNPTDIYSNEEDLINAEIFGNTQIDALAKQQQRALDDQMFNLEMNRTPEETGLERFLEGGLIGADLGMKAQGIIELSDNPVEEIEDTKKKELQDNTNKEQMGKSIDNNMLKLKDVFNNRNYINPLGKDFAKGYNPFLDNKSNDLITDDDKYESYLADLLDISNYKKKNMSKSIYF